MKICEPGTEHIPALRELWKLVFGDGDDFLDLFFGRAFAPDRCLCALEGGLPVGGLYWLPCDGYAYIYAVATHPDHRGKGICRRLMEAAHEAIRRQGYAGAVLYPQEEGLRAMYRKMGYDRETTIRELRCDAGGEPVVLTQIPSKTFFEERPQLLPPDALRQGSPFPELTESLHFYRGEGLLLAATVREGELLAAEYLGPEASASGILRSLGCEKGTFRCPGGDRAFAMVYPLAEDAPVPTYFAFPLD